MAAPTDSMAAAMDKYGISLTDSEGNMKSLRGVIDNLRGSLGGLSETEQTAAASTISERGHGRHVSNHQRQ